MAAFLKIKDMEGEHLHMRRTEVSIEALELLAPGPGPQRIGLLLPAVQKVREAAARPTARPTGLMPVKAPQEPTILIGLLLPAVQKVREAASRNPGNLTSGQQTTAIGLLLPAVQKVREAAARNSGGAVAMRIHSTGSGASLKAIRQTKVLQGNLELPHGGKVDLNEAVVFDVEPQGNTMRVVLGFGSLNNA